MEVDESSGCPVYMTVIAPLAEPIKLFSYVVVDYLNLLAILSLL